jgi:hypothetical protein
MLIHSNMSLETYIPEEKAYAFDKVVALAEASNVALKVVIQELNDELWIKMRDDGSWVLSGSDNTGGFYGPGRVVNKTRWLQQMWWRYLQARWGYSTSIHSWELTNEGDPGLVRHYELTDELGKFMHCRVFGTAVGSGDGAKCNLNHPNAHLVTTSFWQWFPAPEFWANTKYPNVDYADVHAYVSTSFAPLSERTLMQWDSRYLHTWHSQNLRGLNVGKPIVRGETGLDAVDNQSESVLGVSRDTTGVWLHNFLWSALDSGGLYELYWWTTHIWTSSFDHRPQYLGPTNFLRDVPLNKGGYVDWGGTVSNSALKVFGQKNISAGGLILWVQNAAYTWKNVVDGVSIAAQSGEVVVPGFVAGRTYQLERWNTQVPGGQITTTQSLVADGSGSLRIGVTSLQTDAAFKIRASTGGPAAPSDVHVFQ